MAEHLKTYSNNETGAEVRVEMNLRHVIPEAMEALYKLTDLIGTKGWVFTVKRKIPGTHGFKGAVKVMGLCRDLNHVVVRTQNGPGECFEGFMDRRDESGRIIAPSALKEALIEVAGIGWFDPSNPKAKQVRREMVQRPLTSSVGGAVVDKVVQIFGPPVSHPRRTFRGIATDMDASKELFRLMVPKLEDGIISGSDIAKIIRIWVRGKDDGSGCGPGPIIHSWVRRGFLENVREKGGETLYKITDIARSRFSLTFLQYSGLSETALRKEISEVEGEIRRLAAKLSRLTEALSKLIATPDDKGDQPV